MSELLLHKYLESGPERLGFILEDGEIVEVFNNHEDSEKGARYLSKDLFNFAYNPKTENKAVATWHTHPNGSNNLSGEDYEAFKGHPQLTHYIVGKNGVAKYTVDATGTVKND